MKKANKKQRGAIEIARALEGSGIPRMYGCSRAVLEIFMPETLLGADFRYVELSETEKERRANALRPKGYSGERVNVITRFSAQAEPLLPPPTLPLPWTLDAVCWIDVAAHLSKCLRLATGGTNVHVLLVHSSELSGPLRFDAAAAPRRLDGDQVHKRQLRNGGIEVLQERVECCDALLLHNDTDTLLFTPRNELVGTMRRHLDALGYPAANAAVRLAHRLGEPEGTECLRWIRSQKCPNHGSSHTGITTDFGLGDGQLASASQGTGSSGINETLRGGCCHRMAVSVVKGKLAASTCQARADEYCEHRSRVNGDKRFAKISGARMAAFGVTRMDQSGAVQLPYGRSDHCYPRLADHANLRVAALEGQLRAGAADMSMAFCSGLPGIYAASLVQSELGEAEKSMKANDEMGCPFAGASSHLFSKGSLGLMPTKGGHDDCNGPSSLTCWNNLGVAQSGAKLQLILVVRGFDVVVDAPLGQSAWFAAWLPHLTCNDPDGPAGRKDDWRLHHTAYTRWGTEYFAWVARAYRLAGLPIETRPNGEVGSDVGGRRTPTSVMDKVRLLETELGLTSGSNKEELHEAAQKLGVAAADGMALNALADLCVQALHDRD